MINELHKRGVRVLLCEANARVLGKLRIAGVLDALPEGGYGDTLLAALTKVGLGHPVEARHTSQCG